MTSRILRDAVADDVPALLEIYNHYVINTHITFDVVPLTLDERMAWFEKFAESPRNRLVVLEEDGVICGYAHSLPFRPKKAYETTVETTVYVNPDKHGGGRGRALLGHLIEKLGDEDVHSALGGVAQPNDASNRLHLSLGYRPIGTFGEVGRKFGRYFDVTWYERRFPAGRE